MYVHLYIFCNLISLSRWTKLRISIGMYNYKAIFAVHLRIGVNEGMVDTAQYIRRQN